MKRIATANREIDKFGPGKDGFRAAQPGISEPTYLSADFFNAVQESLVRVIERAGMPPSADLDQFADAIDQSIGGATTYLAPGAGAIKRAFSKKLDDRTDARDYGAKGDGLTIDTGAISLSGAAGKLAREYVVDQYDNPHGFDLTPDGVAHNRTSGRVYNPRAQFTARTFGQETMQYWFSKFGGASNKNNGDNVIRRIVISGPSTIFGVGASYGTPQALLEDLAETRGYTNVGVVNRGQSGKATFDWLAYFLDGDLAANPDLLILQWPVNDPFYGRTVKQSIADFRTGLTRIRAARGVDVLSIVVMTPAPMNDVEKGRTELWAEQIGAGLRQAAADFDCAFFDTYGYFQNAHSGAGLWMDKDTSFNPLGRAIHPHDVFYEHIFGQLADLIFPNWGTDWRTNTVRNTSAGDPLAVRSGNEPPGAFFSGIGMHRMGDLVGTPNGAPYDGVAFTFKQADGAVLQFSIPLSGGAYGSGIAARIGFGNSWSEWYGRTITSGITPQNGWAEVGLGFAPLVLQLSLEGRAYINGVLKVGTVADGTIIFQMPGGWRPHYTEIFVVAGELTSCRVSVDSSGNVRIYNAAASGTYISLGGISYKCSAN